MKKPTTKYSTVMLIDDNEIDNFINAKIIESSGFAERVYVHTSSKSALEFLQNVQRDKHLDLSLIPDILFLDINMPIMDGQQFIEEYSKLDSKICNQGKIVMLTSSVNPSDNDKYKAMNHVIEYLLKPLTKKQLNEL